MEELAPADGRWLQITRDHINRSCPSEADTATLLAQLNLPALGGVSAHEPVST